MPKREMATLETEVVKLFKLVERLKVDLASLQEHDGEKPALETAADQISAITAESETATSQIMDASEDISKIAAGLMREIKYGGVQPIFERMLDRSQQIFEACQTHDIIEQRLSRIVRTINQVEGTLNSMVVTVGQDSVADVATAISAIRMMEDDDTSTGPDIDGNGLSQTDVDAIFNEDDAEKRRAQKRSKAKSQLSQYGFAR